ncbi:hypothetical protein RFI_33763 [Reticulomyxa filosa]|uniref:Ion transport domain-containing protein n=1 Tax=Reticulomyxa filosa TaxID=46433 RepID=X6LPS6_RETFI|nr:hypothetical protein RFI_33763 [Reticulomyxa filosa]|eukprot:ETO03639.1 hypothetical protein RFI_33763 [Reticulomyxa filosa]
MFVFWFGVLPALFTVSLYQLAPLQWKTLDAVAIYAFVVNLIEIYVRCYVFGYLRFVDMVNQPDPLLIQVSNQIWRERIGESDDGFGYIHVTADDYQWAAAKNIWDRQRLTWVNRIELWWASVSLIIVVAVLIADSSQHSLLRFWLHMPVLTRVFTLLLVNRTLVLSLYTVIPNFVSLLGVAIAFVCTWARIGSTLFADKEKIVLPDSYSQKPSGGFFQTFPDAVLTLLEVMVGQGWSSIMYLYVLSTRYIYAVYFVVYFVVIAMFIANIFVGLVLAGTGAKAKKKQKNYTTETEKNRTFFLLCKNMLCAGIEELQDREYDSLLISQCFDGTQQQFLQLATSSLEELESERRKNEKKITKIKHLVKLRLKRKQQRKKQPKKSEVWGIRKLFSVDYWSDE